MALSKIVIAGIAAVLIAAPAVALVALSNGNVASDAPVTPASDSKKAMAPTESASTTIQPLRDVLLDVTFPLLPMAAQENVMPANFKVDKDYNMLQVDIFSPADGVWAGAMPSIKVTDPNGDVVVDYSAQVDFSYLPSIPANPAIPSGYESKPYTIGSVYKVVPGEYKVEAMGASTPIQITVLGLKGVAADFLLKDVLGKDETKLSAMKGKVVLIDLFATWCGPCKAAMKTFDDVYSKYSRDEFEILSVDVDMSETESDVKTLFEGNGYTWYAGFDDGTVDKNYGSGFIPTLAIANKDGMLIYRHIGSGLSAEDLSKIIDHGLGK